MEPFPDWSLVTQFNFPFVTALKISCSIELTMHSTYSEVGIESLLPDMITCKDFPRLGGKESSMLSRKVLLGQRRKPMEKTFFCI